MRRNHLRASVATVLGPVIALLVPRATHAEMIQMDLPELADRCAHAVVGTVVDVQSYWNGEQTQILTRIRILADEDFMGNVPSADGILTLTELGGTIGEITLLVEHTPSFTVGERVLVFLEYTPDGRLIVLGRTQGKFTLVPAPGIELDTAGHRVDAGKGVAEGMITRIEPGLDLTTEVRRLMTERGFTPRRLGAAEVPTESESDKAVTERTRPMPTATPLPTVEAAGPTRASNGEAVLTPAEQAYKEALAAGEMVVEEVPGPGLDLSIEATLTPEELERKHAVEAEKPQAEVSWETAEVPAEADDIDGAADVGGGGRSGECRTDYGCSNFVSNYPSGTFSTTSTSWTTVSTCIYGGEYSYYSVTSGYTYEWSLCSGDGGNASYDSQLTLWNSGGSTRYCYSDDYCSDDAKIMWTATFSGTVRVLVSLYNCTSNSTCTTLVWRCASCAPDLTPYQPGQWNDRIPIGITQLGGLDTHNYTGSYYNNQTLYFNWASVNLGSATASNYTVRIEVTGTGGSIWDWTGLTTAAGYYTYLTTDQPVGPLSAGSHTFRMWVDYTGVVSESNEGNNYYERTITVQTAEHCYSCPTYDYGSYTPGSSYVTHAASFQAGGCRWYAFNLDTAYRQYRFTFCEGGGTANADSTLTLYNSSCSQVAYNDDACGLPSRLDYVPTSTGTYYLRVGELGDNAAMSYTLAYAYVPGNCTACPSYNYGPYIPTTSYQTHSGMVPIGGCQQYRFDLTAGNTYRFTFCEGGGTANYDTYLRLRDSGCTQVAYNDDGCGLQSQLDFACAATGTYYLEVNSCCTGSYGGTYTLAYKYTPTCSAPGAPASSATSIGSPANGVEHHLNLSCATVSGAEGYDFDWSPDGSTWYNLAEDVYSAYDVNTGDSPNGPYYFRVRAYACSPRLYSGWTNAAPFPIYTACDNPAAPSVTNPTSTTLEVTLNAETPVANPASTTYSIYCTTTGQYVQANGTLGGTEVFQTRAAWGTRTVTGLSCATTYTFYAKARNQQGDVRYNASNTGSNTTAACPPVITGVSPDHAPAGVGAAGPAGSLVTITGNNFGTKGANDHVMFWSNGANYNWNDGYIVSWTNTQIQCYVPSGCGSRDCAVSKSGTWSNFFAFTVDWSFWFRWQDQSVMPIQYFINQNGSDNIAGDAEFTAARAGVQVWEDVVNSYLDHSYRGTTNRTARNQDGFNVVSWTEAGWTGGAGVIALSQVWLNGNIIIESDIECNGQDFTYTINGVVANQVDVQSLIAHEAGHGYCGLLDLYGGPDTEKTMYGYIDVVNGESKKRTLETQDMAGCNWIYAWAGPSNDACAGALSMGSLPAQRSGKNPLASDDYATACADGPYRNLWYTVTGTGNEIIATTCSLNTTFDTEMAVMTGCGSGCVGHNDDDNTYCTIVTNSSTVRWCSVAGQTYYITVGSYYSGGATGSFELEVRNGEATPATPTGAAANPATVCQGTATSLSCSAPGAGAVDWYSGSCGGTLVGTGNPLSVSPSATTTYYARARSTTSGCSSPGCSSGVTVSVTPAPANDLCPSATTMSLGSPVAGDTRCAGTETLGTCGTSDGTKGGVWYKITGNGNLFTAGTCNDANFDTKIRVYTNGCGTLTCIGGNDDYSGCASNTSRYSWCTQSGQEYLILVHGWSDVEGTFNLTVTQSTCDDGWECTNNTCVDDQYNGGYCSYPPKAPGTACGDPSNVDCNAPDTCDGAGTCVNNFKSSSTVCRSSAGDCDAVEYCPGNGPTCPVDGYQPGGAVCRSATGECDVAETCTGSSVNCPTDAFQPVGTACGGNPSGACDAQNTCNGSGGCVENYQPGGTVCRAVAGDCDVAESCTGSSPNCPADAFQSSSTLCRTDAGDCDVAEYCPGNGPTCPANSYEPTGTACGGAPSGACDAQNTCNGSGGCVENYQPGGTVCRAVAGDCDVAESCTGSSPNCPSDTFLSGGTLCRTDAGDCDLPEYCPGNGPTCPANSYEPAGTSCGGAPSGACDAQNTCNGSGGCVENYQPGGTVCRAVAGDCDLAESCTGSSPNCPADAFQSSSTLCRTDAGDCDVAEYCPGNGPTCPANSYEPVGTACGDPSSTACDAPDTCNGTGACLDNLEPDGTLCDDGALCTYNDHCTFGACAGTLDAEGPTFTYSPPDLTRNADAGGCDALVTITPATAVDDHTNAYVTYERSDNPGLSLADPFPSGTTTITWTATDDCGNETTDLQSITVSPVNNLSVDVQLLYVNIAALNRCVTFELFECGGSSELLTEVIPFSYGLAGDVLLTVDCGDYDCIRARDPLHTLARRLDRGAGFSVIGADYVASFTGTGDGLIGGNLNDDTWIDIIDFGVYVNRWALNYGTGNTTCATPPYHADINGNGTVDTADFTFISSGFLSATETGCCTLARGDGGWAGPVAEISVAELVEVGLADLAVADLNGDGWLDQADVVAFLGGARPTPPTPGPSEVDATEDTVDRPLEIGTVPVPAVR